MTSTETTKTAVPHPHAIRQRLDEFVIGQSRAKIRLSIAAHNHYKRIMGLHGKHAAGEEAVELGNHNVMLVGPTGCGKTLLVETLAKMLNVPYAIADATKLTESGYVGEDVETVLQRLLANADFNVERAQIGIVYIDEIDKKGKKGENMSVTRDVSGEGVQQGLLTLIGGGDVRVPMKGASRKHPEAETIEMSTRNILWIVGGAFVGLDKIVEKRMVGSGGSIGFGAKISEAIDPNEKRHELLKLVEPRDFVSFGLIPEFIGRFPVLTSVDALDEKALRLILTQPKNSIVKQQLALLEGDTKVHFTDGALDEIAHIAAQDETGARSLARIVFDVVAPINYVLPDSVEITREMVRDRANLLERIANDPDPCSIFKRKEVRNAA